MNDSDDTMEEEPEFLETEDMGMESETETETEDEGDQKGSR